MLSVVRPVQPRWCSGYRKSYGFESELVMSLSLSRGRSLEVGHYGLEQTQLPPADQGPIDLRGWFDVDRAAPLELEIGSGKGTFLVEQAERDPGVNFVGIEYAKAYWRYAADRCRRRDLGNVRVVHAEAGFFVRHYVPAVCLRCVHIYFPDPWPKKRHQKRRMVQSPFLALLHSKLQAGGTVRIVTDHAAYFQTMGEQIQHVSDLFEQIPFEKLSSVRDQEWVGTNFERKYRQLGRPFYGMILYKRESM